MSDSALQIELGLASRLMAQASTCLAGLGYRIEDPELPLMIEGRAKKYWAAFMRADCWFGRLEAESRRRAGTVEIDLRTPPRIPPVTLPCAPKKSGTRGVRASPVKPLWSEGSDPFFLSRSESSPQHSSSSRHSVSSFCPIGQASATLERFTFAFVDNVPWRLDTQYRVKSA